MLLVCLVPATVRAQSPDQRAALERWRDSLATVTDSAGLISLESAMIDTARRDRDNTVLHLKLGLLALRLGELGSRSRYDDAGSEFEWARELEPHWPYPLMGLGLAEAGLVDTSYGVMSRIRSMFSADHLTRSVDALANAVRKDSTFVPGLVALADVSRQQLINTDSSGILKIFRNAARGPAARDTAFQLALGQTELLVGSADSALAAFRRYLDLGGDSTIGILELTRTRLATGDTSAQGDYYRLAAGDDPVVVATLGDDIRLIAGDSGVARFDSMSGMARAEFLRDFWSQRDDWDLRGRGERLAEHYRRLFYAERNFRRVPIRRRYRFDDDYHFNDDYHQAIRTLDARGEVYVRYGEPTEKVPFPNFCSTSWRYQRPEGDLIFHFIGNPAQHDYSIAASVLDVCNLEDLGDSRIFGWSPIFSRLVGAGPVTLARLSEEYRYRMRDSVRQAMRSDRFQLTYENRIEATARLEALGTRGDRSLVHVVYAIRGGTVKPFEVATGYEYEIHVRFAAFGADGATLLTTDTTHFFRTRRRLPDGEFITGHDIVALPPGAITYRLALEMPDSTGGAFPADSFVVSRFEPGLALSDLVLGNRAIGPVWTPTPRDTVWFNPLGTFRPADAMELYYEVYGLPPGAVFRTRLAVYRSDREQAEIAFDFSEQAAPRGPTRVHRSIELSRLRSGDYTFEVGLTGPDGTVVTKRRQFTVLK
ncbi:MAG: hypothetical protein AB7I33_05785 [Gemmatimonadales bacterium]